MGRYQIERSLKDVPRTLARAKQEAEKFRSVWEGDEEAGRYELRTPVGTVAGTYTVEGKTVRFDVAKKPAVVPRALLERVLDAFLRGGE